ncbi:MAG: TolC family protein [Bergeyella sp.]
MKTLKSKIFLLSFLVPVLLFSQSAPTLKELIDSAMVNDGNLNEQILQNRITGLNDERLKDIFLPKVDISGKAGYMYTSARITTPEINFPAVPNLFPGTVIPEYSNNLNISGITTAMKAEASVLVYSGGKVKYLKEANKEKSLSEQKMMDKTRDEIITEISKSYDLFALLEESRKVLDEGKKRLDINRKTADKALGYGLITPYDHKKVELAQATLDSKIVEYEGKKELLITQLHLLTGIERERIAMIQTELSPISYAVIDSDVDNRAEIQALEHGIKASEYKIKAEEKWWIPKVQAQTSLSYIGLFDNHISTSKGLMNGIGRKLDFTSSNLNIFPFFQAGIGFKWEIFDGNEGKVNIEEARINKEILENKKKDARKKLTLNLANNQTSYEIAEAQIKLKNKARSIAKTALENVEKEFRYGTKKSSDLIDAEYDLENAELEYRTAIFNQRRSAVELMKSTQKLDVDKL